MTTHDYGATLTWSGSTAVGHRSFRRSHTAALTSRTELELSADAAFRGDVDLPNPEQLVVAAASSCQLLSFLGAAARAGVDVVAYSDSARGEMPGVGQSGGNASRVSITEIELRPVIRVRDADPEKVKELVVRAHDQCYVANSLRSNTTILPAGSGSRWWTSVFAMVGWSRRTEHGGCRTPAAATRLEPSVSHCSSRRRRAH